MIYKNLEFFLKSGDSLSLDFDSVNDVWTGSLYVPKISTGLFESEHIFIYETILNQDDIKYLCKPHSIIENSFINASWEDVTTEQIKLYTTQDTNIFFVNNLNIDIEYFSTDILFNNYIKSYNIDESHTSINIAAYSDIEGSYYNILQLKESITDHVFARILVYSEFEGEDERLEILCNNLGYFINKEDESIFTESDVEEPKTNHILLNQKRKEILLEGSNIYNYIGSYKGLLNVISYFGFDELRIREYWKNINSTTIDYLKIKHFDIGVKKTNDQELLSNNYKKLNDISLVYKINDVTKEYNRFDLPVTIDVYKYTIDEVLIKLFGLKNKLKNNFLPYNIYVKDIIGEKTFFANKTKLSTTSVNGSLFVNEGLTPDIKIASTNNYIIDLRNIDELITQYNLTVNHNIKADDLTTISNLYDYILALFTTTYPGVKSIERLPDKEDITIGCPVIFENVTFDDSIKDIEATYNDLTSENDYIYDFKISGFGIQDIFTIKDTASQTQISVTASYGESNNDIIVDLYTQIKNTTLLPWIYFTPSIVEISGENVLRLSGTGLNNNIKFDFQTIVTPGIGSTIQSFNKVIVPTINTKTIETIGYKNYYEVEWRVYNNNNFNYIVRGGIDEYKKLLINLPYVGFYDVDIILYNTLNIASKKTFRNFIEVKMKEVEFVGVYKRISEDYVDIKSLENISFEEDKICSLFPIIVNKTMLKDCDVTFDTLDTIGILPNIDYSDNLLHTIQNYKPSGNISFPGPVTFDSIGDKVQLKDFDYLTFDMLDLTGNTPATFKINSVNIGGELVIVFPNNIIGKHTFTTTDLENATLELNTNGNNIISRYIYNYVGNYIQATGKITGSYSEFKSIAGNGITLGEVVNTKKRGFSINDFIILKDFMQFTGCAYILLTADPCKIPGKVKYEWVIDNIQIKDYKKMFFYTKNINVFFYDKGKYTVKLTITDSFGNTKAYTKNMIYLK